MLPFVAKSRLTGKMRHAASCLSICNVCREKLSIVRNEMNSYVTLEADIELALLEISSLVSDIRKWLERC